MIIIINVVIMIHENDNGCADDDDDNDVYSDGFMTFSILELGCDICTFSM